MASCEDPNLLNVIENGPNGDQYEYRLDISTEPATVIVKVCSSQSPPTTYSTDITGSSGCEDDGPLPDKRRRLDDKSHSTAEKQVSNSETVYNPTGGSENLLIEDDEGEYEDVHQFDDFVESESTIPQAVGANLNESENENLHSATEWSQDLKHFPVIPPFTGESGLHIDTEEDCSVLSCFKLFFTDWLLEHLRTQTNKFADDMRAANTEELDREGGNILKNWKPLTLTEMKGYIVILIHMGVVKKKFYRDYWSQDTFSASPFANQILTRERFISVIKLFQMNDNHSYIPASQPGHDPIHKIRPVYEYLQGRFQAVYTPSKYLALDEATHFDLTPSSSDQHDGIVHLTGTSSNHTGLKLYKLYECDTGYVTNMELCSAPSETCDPTKIALSLMAPFLDKGYHVYSDSNFTSLGLYTALTDNNTMCTGAIGPHGDDMPEDLVSEDLPVMGQIAFRRKGKLCAVRWNPSSSKLAEGDVLILTSAHHSLETTSSKRDGSKSNGGTASSKGKPVCVNDYNKTMSAVISHMNQITECTPLPHQPLKWFKQIFLHLLTLSTRQAMIVYNKIQSKKGGKILTLQLFIKELGKQLSEEYVLERGVAVPSLHIAPLKEKPNPLLRTDHSYFHHLVRIEKSFAKKPRKVCRVCMDTVRYIKSTTHTHFYMRNVKKTVNTVCKICKTALCVVPCFYLYHNEVDYITVGSTMDHYISLLSESSRNAVACPVNNDEDS